MKSLGNFPDPFLAEISGQPEAIRRAAAGLEDQRGVLERLASLARDRAVVFTGMGSSYDACYPAVNALAVAGIPSVHVDSSELLHFRQNLLAAAGILVVVSQSGESAEVIRLVESMGRGDRMPLVVGVTNGKSNSLAHRANLMLDTMAGDEVGPSTMTFCGALVVLAAVARALRGELIGDVVRHLIRDAEPAAESQRRLLALPLLPDQLATWAEGHPTTVILGRGSARAAAEMGALTLKEAVGMPIEALQTAQFRHGPLELAGPELAAMIIATEPETRHLDIGLATELIDAGAAVSVVVESGGVPPGAMHVEIGQQDQMLASAVSIVPAQLLAWKLAVLRGRPPGSYLRASKVTIRE